MIQGNLALSIKRILHSFNQLLNENLLENFCLLYLPYQNIVIDISLFYQIRLLYYCSYNLHDFFLYFLAHKDN